MTEPTTPPEAADGRHSSPGAPDRQPDASDGENAAQTGAQGSALRELIAAAMLRTIRSYGELPTPDAIRLVDEMAQAILNDLLPIGQFNADMHRDTDRQLNAIIDYARTRGVISIDRIRYILEQPAGHDSGPTVREAAAQDRRWDYERHGE